MDAVFLLGRALIIGWLPGAALFRVPILDRDRRAALPAEERWYWAVMLSAAVSLSIVLALAAAHRYSLTRLLVANLVIAIGAAAGARLKLRFNGTAARPGLAVLLPIAIATI